jgi:hypothetical protein
MQQFKPLDFTNLHLDGQVKVITIKEPALPAVKTDKMPYVLLTCSLIVLAGVVAYYNNLVSRKEEELKRLQKRF